MDTSKVNSWWNVRCCQKTNVVKRFTHSLQNRVFEGEKFELLISGGDVLEVSALDASTEQVTQLFGDGNLRICVNKKHISRTASCRMILNHRSYPTMFPKVRLYSARILNLQGQR